MVVFEVMVCLSILRLRLWSFGLGNQVSPVNFTTTPLMHIVVVGVLRYMVGGCQLFVGLS